MLTDASIPSPCTNQCRLDPSGMHCMGCWRTIGEIAAWREMDDVRRSAVLQALERRRAEASVVDDGLAP